MTTNHRRLKVGVGLAVAIGTLLLTTGSTFSVDPGTRTVTAGAFVVQWSLSNPEEIVSLEWNASPNLTNPAAAAGCPGGGDLEYFGDSWGTGESYDFVAPVGWGTTGTWSSATMNDVSIASSATGCYGTSGIPVQTGYRFWDHGPTADRIKVQRKIDFGSTPFAYDVRPYIPRLYPREDYSQVIHPNAAGTGIVTETSADCEHGCEVTDWDESWFAVHDPATGRGMIVRHAASPYPAALWIDQDEASHTTSSSVLLLQPSGGFTGKVVETEFLCFYDTSTWTPSLALPAGC